ncbi:MAG: hypothetical protein DWI58_05350 [Chloroflexi bacterium]|nr:MAG: hypothetical protein DWI58_05350 [Chloroflexota bacterium]
METAVDDPRHHAAGRAGEQRAVAQEDERRGGRGAPRAGHAAARPRGRAEGGRSRRARRRRCERRFAAARGVDRAGVAEALTPTLSHCVGEGARKADQKPRPCMERAG